MAESATTETAIVDKPAEQADDLGHGHITATLTSRGGRRGLGFWPPISLRLLIEPGNGTPDPGR